MSEVLLYGPTGDCQCGEVDCPPQQSCNVRTKHAERFFHVLGFPALVTVGAFSNNDLYVPELLWPAARWKFDLAAGEVVPAEMQDYGRGGAEPYDDEVLLPLAYRGADFDQPKLVWTRGDLIGSVPGVGQARVKETFASTQGNFTWPSLSTKLAGIQDKWFDTNYRLRLYNDVAAPAAQGANWRAYTERFLRLRITTTATKLAGAAPLEGVWREQFDVDRLTGAITHTVLEDTPGWAMGPYDLTAFAYPTVKAGATLTAWGRMTEIAPAPDTVKRQTIQWEYSSGYGTVNVTWEVEYSVPNKEDDFEAACSAIVMSTPLVDANTQTLMPYNRTVSTTLAGVPMLRAEMKHCQAIYEVDQPCRYTAEQILPLPTAPDGVSNAGVPAPYWATIDDRTVWFSCGVWHQCYTRRFWRQIERISVNGSATFDYPPLAFKAAVIPVGYDAVPTGNWFFLRAVAGPC
jgi:hypothetical protein